MSAQTYTQFLAYSGYTSTTIPNESYTKYLLDAVCEIIADYLDLQFYLEPNVTREYQGNNMTERVIGGWQPENLDIKLRYYENTTESLVVNRDYELQYYQDNSNNAVTSIRLRSGFYGYFGHGYGYAGNYGSSLFDKSSKPKFGRDTYLIVSGTYGFSNGFPADLRQTIYSTIKTMVETNQQFTDSQGAGFGGGLRSVTLDVKDYNMPDNLVEDLVGLGFDPLTSKLIYKKLLKYLPAGRQMVTLP